MIFFKLLHIPPFFNKKTLLKQVYKETTYTFLHDTFRTKEFSPKNHRPPILGSLKKITPKSQAKTKPPFPQYPFLTLKRYHAIKYTILSFNFIMRIYSNTHIYAIYTLNYYEKYFTRLLKISINNRPLLYIPINTHKYT